MRIAIVALLTLMAAQDAPPKAALESFGEFLVSRPVKHKNLSLYFLYRDEKPAAGPEFLGAQEAIRQGQALFQETPAGGKSSWRELNNKSAKTILVLEGESLHKSEKRELKSLGDYLLPPGSTEKLLTESVAGDEDQARDLAAFEKALSGSLGTHEASFGMVYAVGSRIVRCDAFASTALFKTAFPTLLRLAAARALGSPAGEAEGPSAPDVAAFLTGRKGKTLTANQKGGAFLFRKESLP